MEPTVDIYLGPQPTSKERMERMLTVGAMVLVFVVLVTLVSAFLAV